MRASPLILVGLAACATSEGLSVDGRAEQKAVLPVRFESGQPMVDVTIGASTFALVLDTGASGTIWLSPREAERAGAVWTGGSAIYRDAYGSAYVSREYVLDECDLGGIKVRAVEGREYVTTGPRGNEVQGILGMGVLRAFRVTFDLPAGFLELDLPAGRSLAPAGLVPVAARFSRDGVVTTLQVDEAPVDLLWDTGASASILGKGVIADELLTQRGELRVYQGRRVVSGRLDLGPETFVVLDVPGLPAEGIVGAPVFKRTRVVLDVAAGLLAVGPAR